MDVPEVGQEVARHVLAASAGGVVLLRGDGEESVCVHRCSLGFSDGHTSWRLSINSVFFPNNRWCSAKKGNFQAKKTAQGENASGGIRKAGIRCILNHEQHRNTANKTTAIAFLMIRR